MLLVCSLFSARHWGCYIDKDSCVCILVVCDVFCITVKSLLFWESLLSKLTPSRGPISQDDDRLSSRAGGGPSGSGCCAWLSDCRSSSWKLTCRTMLMGSASTCLVLSEDTVCGADVSVWMVWLVLMFCHVREVLVRILTRTTYVQASFLFFLTLSWVVTSTGSQLLYFAYVPILHCHLIIGQYVYILMALLN